MGRDFNVQDFLIKIGENLLELRKKNGLNQEQAAELAGYDGPQRRMNFFRLEHGMNDIPITRLARFCSALDVPLTDVLKFEPPAITGSNVKQLKSSESNVDTKFLNQYLLLTNEDRLLVDTMIDTMLRTDKYQQQEAKKA